MRVVGLMSGTSADGIDGVLVEINGQGWDLSVEVIAATSCPYPPRLQRQILDLAAGEAVSLADLAAVDDAIATLFADTALSLPAAELIASHGQTVYHRPANGTLGYSLQLGRGELIAQRSQRPVISNFRHGDIAAGGQGAPLVPPVDVCLFRHPSQYRCIQNIGGIGNLTYLPPNTEEAPILGWDTGPGNSLLDIAVEALSGGELTYDADGAWAAQGQPHANLVERWMAHAYFHQSPPKSTGRELFGWEFFQRCHRDAQAAGLSAPDVLATLSELTATSIAHSYRQFLPRYPDAVFLCGGGSHNLDLIERLSRHLAPAQVATTAALGVPPATKEAIAFAVLGYWRWHRFPGNLPSVTGACRSALLGEIHQPLTEKVRPA